MRSGRWVPCLLCSRQRAVSWGQMCVQNGSTCGVTSNLERRGGRALTWGQSDPAVQGAADKGTSVNSCQRCIANRCTGQKVWGRPG